MTRTSIGTLILLAILTGFFLGVCCASISHAQEEPGNIEMLNHGPASPTVKGRIDQLNEDAHTQGHARYHTDYMRWKNSNGFPCCSAKYDEHGVPMSGDCVPTEGILRPSLKPELNGAVVWWLFIEETGRFEEMPEGKMLRERNPDDTGRAAHACVSQSLSPSVPPEEVGGYIYCWVPPSGSM
jgi:hypothetical protein